MAIVNTTTTNTFDEWRIDTNLLGTAVGNLTNLTEVLTRGTDVIGALTDISTNLATAEVTIAAIPATYVDVAGDTMTGDLNFNDNVDANFGTGADLKITHNGTNTSLTNITGQLRIGGNDIRIQSQNHSEDYILCVDGGAVTLHHNNLPKIATTATGATITGSIKISDAGTIGSATTSDAIAIASTGIVTFKDDILIKDGGTIGSATTTDAITIASTGIVSFRKNIVFEGATANDYETTLSFTDPTADRTWTIPNASDTFVGQATTDTLTNKTLTNAVLNGTISGTSIKDEDDMSSNSASYLATQQSIKKYVDDTVTGQDLDFQGDSGGALSIDLDSETLDIAGGTGIDTSGSSNTLTVAIDSTVVATLTGNQTLTNKTLTSPVFNTGVSGTAVLDSDTMTGVSSTKLASSESIKAYVDAQVTAQDVDITTDSGTIAIDLDSETLTFTGGTGIDSSATGNAVTHAIDSTVTTLTGSQTLTNKSLTSPAITGSISGDAFLDEDDLASNSATKVASQQSIKAYVDGSLMQEITQDSIGAMFSQVRTVSAHDGDSHEDTVYQILSVGNTTQLQWEAIGVPDTNPETTAVKGLVFTANDTDGTGTGTVTYKADNSIQTNVSVQYDDATGVVNFVTPAELTGNITGNATTVTVNDTTDTTAYVGLWESASGSQQGKTDAGITYNAGTGMLTVTGDISSGGSLILGSASMSETDLEKLDGITNGTAAASKALVLDTNKDIGTIRNLTIDGVFTDGNYTFDTSGNVSGLGTIGSGAITSTGIVTGTGFTVGNAIISETELEQIDGITAGTVLASKAVVVNSNKDIGTFRNLTINGVFTDGNYTFDTSGNVTGLGNITTTGYIRGPASFTIDPATHGDDTGTVVIAGNLQVDGTTTTINSTTVAIDDLNFSIATDAADSAAANGAGITIGGAGATMLYTHATTSWDFNKDVIVNGYVAADNIKLDGNTISSTDTNGNLVLSANGTGVVDINDTLDVDGITYLDNIKLDGNTISSTDTNGSLTLTPNGTGNLVLDGVNWPQADGTADYFLKTNGSGQTSWATPTNTNQLTTFTVSATTDTTPTTISQGDDLLFTAGTGITCETTADGTVTITNTHSVGDGGLTTKDFTTTLKNKLDEIESSADVNRSISDSISTTSSSTSASSTAVKSAYDVGNHSHPYASSDYLVVNSSGTASSATGTDAIAIGANAGSSAGDGVVMGNTATIVASATKSVAIGFNANVSVAAGTSSVAIGDSATISSLANAGVAIGHDATSSGLTAVSIGNGSDATGSSSTAVGSSAQALVGTGTIAIGSGIADATKAVAIGFSAEAHGDSSVALGDNADVEIGSINGIAIGNDSDVDGNNAIAIGFSATASFYNTIAIGEGALATNADSIAIGDLAKAAGVDSIAIGEDANATSTDSLAIGDASQSTGSQAIAIGNAADANSATSISIGSNSDAGATAAISIGGSSNAYGVSSVAIGENANCNSLGTNAVALGNDADANQSNTVAIGNGAQATSADAIAIGAVATAAFGNSGAFGNDAIARATNVITLGASDHLVELGRQTDAADNDLAVVTKLYLENNTSYSAGAGLDLSGTTFSVETDLRDGILYIGRDSGDYIGWTNNTHTSFFVNGGEEMRLEADGDLHVDGDVIAYSTTIASDERLKDNIEVVEDALDKVKQLRGVTFNRKEDGVASAGVIAQDVEKVLPQAVKEKALPLQTGDEETKYKTVNYDALHAILIEAIKELSAKVEELENK